jgi:hypothetical protein
MTDSEIIRGVYPRHTLKQLARATGAPIDTVRHWVYRHLSSDRRRELATELLAEMDRQDAEDRQTIRRRLAEWAAKE